MEPRKVANCFTLFTLHTIWLMVRAIYHLVLVVSLFRLCCVWFLPRQSYIHIRLRKHSQNAKQLLTPSVLLKSKWFHPFRTTENLQHDSYCFLSTRDAFPMCWRHVSHHPKMALAALQKQEKEMVIQTNAFLLPVTERKKNTLFMEGTIW